MKKKILYIALIVICVSLLAGTSLAYFSTSATAGNIITTGGVEVQVLEQQLVNGSLQSYPTERIPVMPGVEVSKIVSAQCIEQAAWLRMGYTVTVYDSEGEVVDIPADELAAAVIIEPDSENWSFKDGWWYCSEAVKPGQASPALFEKVSFSGPNMDNKFQGCTVTVKVTAQAVQQINNGSAVMEAQGWPAG